MSDFKSRSFNVIAAQVVFILLAYTLRQWQLWKWLQAEPAGKTPELLQRRLDIHRQYVVLYLAHAHTQMSLVTFRREALEMAPQAQAKALQKVRQPEQTFLAPLDNIRPP